jgi:hypothetical protein
MSTRTPAHLWDAANPADSREATIASKVANEPTGSWFTTYNPAAVSWAGYLPKESVATSSGPVKTR